MQRLLQAMLDASIDPALVVTTAGRIALANDAASALFRVPRAELAGRAITDFARASDANPSERWRELLARKNVEHEVTFERDGGARTVRVKLTANVAPDAHVLVLRDITDTNERADLVGELSKSEAQYRRVVESMSDGLFLVTPDGRITLVNAAACAIFGRTAEELVGVSATDLVAPSERDHVRERLSRRRRALSDDYVIEARRKDGSPLWIEIRAHPLLGADQHLTGIVCLVEDLSERRAAEAVRERLSDAEKQLHHMQKLEAIGVLAGGVAHDFNNILAVILSYAHTIHETLGPTDPRLEEIDEIRRAAERATTLTRQLLAFSRRQVLSPRPVDLAEVLHALEKMLRRLVREDIEVSARAREGCGLVHVDPGQIEQVVMNLVVNSRDAMPNGGTIEITVEPIDLFEAPPVGVPPGRYVRLRVADTGGGMDDETRAHVFEPFFTTKKPGEGTGLGLSTVFGIVKQSGGYITLETELGHGTTFDVYLPRIEAHAQPVVTRAVEALPGGRETILLVEDDEHVRQSLDAALRRRGYAVVTAADMADAIVKAKRHPGNIDLLLTDVIMPGGSGPQLAQRLRKTHARLRTLYMSGHTADTIARLGIFDGPVPFLNKPATVSALLSKVREVLDAAA